ASVAAEGFGDLSAALEAALKGSDPLMGLGLAYVEFALRKKGLFRLMFGPLLVDRAKYPALNNAAGATMALIQRVTAAAQARPDDQSAGAMATWGLVHGISSL